MYTEQYCVTYVGYLELMWFQCRGAWVPIGYYYY